MARRSTWRILLLAAAAVVLAGSYGRGVAAAPVALVPVAGAGSAWGEATVWSGEEFYGLTSFYGFSGMGVQQLDEGHDGDGGLSSPPPPPPP
eukprot:CAMPEP_0197604402 /NCGR_PEP_ID=MMETSP1326-20131121/41106_1 /TAXON_ID=1155430 /ORGANISM="Genus nov. species nov., Strain RCC2288" /LENGTH=91 /DNA_ID=CAMNT_0043172055 /DNA_START=139 /DNA_END=411 /DNA_ORIENTATION=+